MIEHLGPYQLGPNDENQGIYTGDALQMLTELPANSIDGLVTDPPYSSGGMFRSDRTASTRNKYAKTETFKKYPLFEGDSRDQRSYSLWCSLWLSECWRAIKPGGIAMVFTDWRQYPTMSDAFQAGGFVWRGVFVWNKTEAARPIKGRFRSQAEFVLWGSKEGMKEAVTECLPGVFTKSVNAQEKYHQTGKPVELMALLLRILAPGMMIIDPFAGSGSTLVAAKICGLRYIGFEINETYATLARERVRQTSFPLFTMEQEEQRQLL